MIIRVVGVLGMILGLNWIFSGVTNFSHLLHLSHNADNSWKMIGALALAILGLFFLFYGTKWTREGDAKKNEKLLEQKQKNLQGLKGWLILVALGLIVSLVRIPIVLISLFSPIFKNGAWQILITPGSEAYNPHFALYLTAELGVNIGLLLVSSYLCYLFFTKSKSFPKWFIIITLANLVFLFVDAYILKFMVPSEMVFDPDSSKEISRSIVNCLIWIPYMLESKRVKATFV